jgi:hypothetical protein
MNSYANSSNYRFDVFNPEFDCSASSRVVNKYEDGGKWICDVGGLFGTGYKEFVKPEKCIAYSVGSNFDTSFEVELKKATHENCDIFTFDPTLKGRGIGEKAFSKKAAKEGITFKPWGLSNETNEATNFYNFNDIMKNLGHSKVDLFKIDCEGCEYSSFQKIFEECESDPSSVPFSMLLIELHRRPFSVISDFFSGADKCGLLLYHKEPNHGDAMDTLVWNSRL